MLPAWFSGIALREDSHFHATLVLAPLRRVLSELGRRLCDAGVLADPAEVHHLRFEELAGMVDAGGTASLAAIVAGGYGIPAVMGAGASTRALQDGQLVLADGTCGHVTAAVT